MVIRASLFHKIANGFLLRAVCVVLPDRLSRHRVVSQEQLSSMEDAGSLGTARRPDRSLPRPRDGGAA